MALPKTINIGYVGEKYYKGYDIDISDLLVDYPTAVPVLYHKRDGDTDGYPAVTTLTGTILHWSFSNVDTAKKGFGEAQIVLTTPDGNHIGMSKVMETVTGRSLTQSSTVPAAFVPYITQIGVLKAEMQSIYDDIEDKGEEIDSAITAGLASIESKKTQSVSAVNTTKDEALDALGVKYGEIYQLATSALAGITLSGNEKIDAVKAEGTTQKAAIDSKTAEFSTYLSEQKEDIVTSANTATQAKNDAVSAKNDAVTAKNQAEQAVAGVNQVNASVAKSGNTATITMTSKTGAVTTATVTDGANGTNGDPGVYVQDTAPTAEGAKVWLKENGSQTVKLLTENDIPDVPVKGVQVAGSELTPDADGKVNVPVATSGQYGVAKFDSSLGLGILNDGRAYLNQNKSWIENRSDNRPVTTNQTNLVVKSALTDSKRIGVNGDGMTDSEKKNACNVIGALNNSNCDVYIETVIEEESTEVIINIDKPCTYLFVKLFTPNATGSAWGHIYIQQSGSTSWNQACMCNSIVSNNKYTYARFKVENGRLFSIGISGATSEGNALSVVQYGSGFGFVELSSIKSIKFYSSSSTVKFPIGTKVNICGVSL